MDYSPHVNTLFLRGVTTIQYNINTRPRYTKNRPITKVCTFEVGDKIKTMNSREHLKEGEIMNDIMYTMCDNKFKISPVREYKCFNITLKNFKNTRVIRRFVLGYEISEKEIIIRLTDGTIKRYQRNEWTIVHTSIHYF